MHGPLVSDLLIIAAQGLGHVPERHSDDAAVGDGDLAMIRADHPRETLVVGMGIRCAEAARGDAGDATAGLVETQERGLGRSLERGADLLPLELVLAPAEQAPQVRDELAEQVGIVEDLVGEDGRAIVLLLATGRLTQWSLLHRFIQCSFSETFGN